MPPTTGQQYQGNRTSLGNLGNLGNLGHSGNRTSWHRRPVYLLLQKGEIQCHSKAPKRCTLFRFLLPTAIRCEQLDGLGGLEGCGAFYSTYHMEVANASCTEGACSATVDIDGVILQYEVLQTRNLFFVVIVLLFGLILWLVKYNRLSRKSSRFALQGGIHPMPERIQERIGLLA